MDGPGFPLNILGGNNVDDKFICSNCKMILNNPHQVECGHRFCKLCIDWMACECNVTCSSCMSDGEKSTINFSNVFPDNSIRRELDKLTAACPNCAWIGDFKSYRDSHHGSCNSANTLTSAACGAVGSKIAELTQRSKIFEGALLTLSHEMERVDVSIESIERKIYNIVSEEDAKSRKIDLLTRQLEIKDAIIAELSMKISNLETTSFDGSFVWVITEFEKKRQDAISGKTSSFYSEPFFTNKFGYKMCARIYLNGDGMGRGTHISLFFVVMRHRYDAMLAWPFKRKVTFMFLDQNNKEHVLDAFRPDPSSSSFKRPTSEMNIASGCPLFLPLSYLENSGVTYVKDDIAFLKIMVEE